MSKPKVYVVGDGGSDHFEADQVEFDVNAGALFIAPVLRTFLSEDKAKVDGLVQIEPIGGSDAEAYTALRPKTAELRRYGRAWRISRYAHSTKTKKAQGKGDNNEVPAPRRFVLETPAEISARFLVAHHAGAAWEGTAAQAHSRLVSKFLASFDGTEPDFSPIIVNLSDTLPELRAPVARGDDALQFHSELWERLREEHWKQVAIVTSLTALRQAGVFLTRRLSWEHGVEDLSAELHRFPRLKALTQFRHLFVRLGLGGIVHVERTECAGAACALSGRIYYTPNADRSVHRDHEAEGGTIGRNTVFIAALIGHLLQDAQRDLRGKVIAPCLEALRRIDDLGYREEAWSNVNSTQIGDELIADLASCAKKVFDTYKPPEPGAVGSVAVSPIPAHVLSPPSPNSLQPVKRWHILDEALVAAPVHRINVAMAIVLGGHEKVLNRRWDAKSAKDFKGLEKNVWKLLTRPEYYNPKDHAPDYVTLRPGNRPAIPEWPLPGSPTPQILGDLRKPFEICVPVSKLGELVLIERDEIEMLRGISNLLGLYRLQVRLGQNRKPISVAVFGPPGSGKSFAVKQVAEHLGGKGAIPILEFNVSQFRSLEDLGAAFTDVIKVRNGRPEVTPLVFFDEFDCVWEGRELGWLKSFLAPMQDGTFQNGSAAIGPAIFVFAGGLHPSFDKFDPTTDTSYDNLREMEEYKRRLKAFVEQKGPDFISRLRGHINVLEINDEQGRVKHFIRRAMQLRVLLAQSGRIDSIDGLARIDDAIVYALLTVDRYRHGVRSMQAIVGMCTPIYDRIDIASLPPRAQLNMHVDAEEFLIRVQRGRLRAQPEWQSEMM